MKKIEPSNKNNRDMGHPPKEEQQEEKENDNKMGIDLHHILSWASKFRWQFRSPFHIFQNEIGKVSQEIKDIE